MPLKPEAHLLKLLKPETNLKRMSAKTLARYLFDAFERHSHPECANMDEMAHAIEMKKHIAPDLKAHHANMSVSQEMWVVAILIDRFKRAANPDLTIPDALKPFGERICNNPVFEQAFAEVRDYLRTPALKRA